MQPKPLSHLRNLSWLDWLGLSTLFVAATLIFTDYAVTDMRRWPALAASLAIVGIAVWQDLGERPPRKAHIGLALVALLIVALMLLDANLTALIILLFVMSGDAMVALPVRHGYLWIGLFGLLTVVYTTSLIGPEPLAVMMALGCFAGYIFIGSAVDAQRRAEQARAESQRLLQELERTHRRLQDSAQQAEALAVAEERNRLARELHDTLGHRLTVAAVQLEGAQRLIARDPAKAERMVATVREQVVDGLGELRRTVAALRTPLETELSLPNAIARVARNFEDATGIRVHLTLAELGDEPAAATRDALYRAVQEGLTNVQRHAQAGTAWVELAACDGVIEVSVEDDGIGIQTAAGDTGFGLRGIEERAGPLGGRFSAGHSRHGGTCVRLSLPYRPQPLAASMPGAHP
jgi:signal transduction histidine kinase